MNVLQGNKLESIFDGREDDIYSRAQASSNDGTDKDKKPLHIINKTPLDFEETTKTHLATTTELAMQINEVFRPLFSDWYGSDVIVDNNGKLLVNFVFKAVTGANVDSNKRAFLPMDQTIEKSSNKVMNRISQINNLNNSKSRVLEITDYGAEMIYDVLNNQVRKHMNAFKPASLRPIIGEVYENTGYNNTVQNIYTTVMGVDINKILGILFGTNDTSEGQIIYGIDPKRPVMANQIPGARTNYVVEIQRMSIRRFNDAMNKLGAVPMPGAITAITETVGETIR